MNCHEFQNWLSDVEVTHDRSAALSHLSECESSDCRQLWEEHLLVEDAITRWSRDIPEVDVIDQVWSVVQRPAVTIAAPSVSRSEDSGRRAWAALAMTAAIVGIAVLGLTGFNSPTGDHTSSMIAENPEVETPEAEQPLQRYSIASVSLAQRASAFVADAALLTVQDVGDPDDPTRPVSAWATKFSERLQPLGENFSEALQYIDKVIPDMSMMQMVPTS